MRWISTKEKLPPANKWVFGKHNRGTWFDKDDQENVNTVVVKRIEGISMDDRKYMNEQRAKTHKSEDEGGNNLTPYNYQCFGPDSFFGQDITHWMEIPPLRDGNI